MLCASNRLKRAVVPRWKNPNLLCISSFLSSPCNYRTIDRGGLVKTLHLSISYFLNTKYISSNPVKVQWMCPLYFTPSICTFRSRSLVTEASVEEEEVAYQVLGEIVSELQKCPSSVMESCTNHISKLCRKKKLRAAAKLLQLLRDEHAINSLPAYNLLLAVACEENDTGIVSLIFKDMLVNHLLMNSTTYFNVAKAISKSNDLTLVLIFVKEILELICTGSVTVVNRIIYAFADCGHVHNAILVFDHMKSLKCEPDLITYNTMLGIFGKTGQVDEMLNVFASMKKVNIAPDIVSYNTLLNSLRKVGRFDFCVVLTVEMGKVGLQPDLRTYTALIECFLRSGNIEESLRLFQDMKRGHICPSIYIYRSLISNLNRLGKSELALKFLEEMNECEGDLVGPKDFKQKSR
ncbi:pentatricopeptide repeat-containing protein At1g11900 isoform X1 [Cynara cardunculus var. scolymus]|uniref:pentatricopeptide repeat-containing protein At1g11900 isoform X1 n=1 Tax=Cynara cardunculus var. scolymus TaxID=59895 RepID=UPI000D626CD7|nr:pentatricopeptide repeat-containing protein At1g11900 isoform X1 [Cynara cardunculus var. scolymus]XP_024988442.1 pentatricopeptide repeat-containing protein At1g11900 isoform X1 [Cynara cardunculus var. scolymus]